MHTKIYFTIHYLALQRYDITFKIKKYNHYLCEKFQKMELSPELKEFIRTHANDDTDKLLLSPHRYPGIDIPFAVDQILSRRQVREKLPDWYANGEIIYPSRLSTEQCSSELTGRYKQSLLKGTSCCDLTGGLGVDSSFFAEKAERMTYIERFPAYCEAARHNFRALGINHIEIISADMREIADKLQADTFYIDPARRADCNKRVFALTDCEPDIIQLKPILLEHAQRLIIKISPMADLEETLRLLPETREIHVVAVRNECKELLFILEGDTSCTDFQAVNIQAVNLNEQRNDRQQLNFTLAEEKEAPLQIASNVGSYLYEPHAAILKSGAFKTTALRHSVEKLHRHSHLYTSDTLHPEFPGRQFIVEEVMPFSGKLLKQIVKQIPHANITTRNFPLTVAEIRKRSHIKEGGDIYLFATTLADEQKVIIKTRKTVPTAGQATTHTAGSPCSCGSPENGEGQ